MEKRRINAIEFLIGLVAGLTAGVFLGILLAPRPGAETRYRIADRATGFRSTAVDLMDQAKESIEQAAIQVERVVGLQERNLRKKLDEIKAQLDEYHLNEA